MPTYEYECQRCGIRFELFQNMTDKPRRRCPECRGGVRRLLGAGAGLLFKGSGFYATDYRSESYRQAASAADKTVSAGDKKPAEKKKAAKAEPAAKKA